MPDRILRALDIAGNRKGDPVPSPEAGAALPGPADSSLTGPPPPSVGAGEVPTLASPTLAALYASQGHGDMAAAIYARLGQGSGGLPQRGHRGSAVPTGQESEGIVARLQALARAARRRRGETRGATLAPTTEDVADDR